MNLGLPEMMFIFVLALLLFGPKKLPEIGRQIGKAMAEFKRASNEFKSQLETEIRQMEVEETLRKETDELTRAILPPEGTVATLPATSAAPYPETAEGQGLVMPTLPEAAPPAAPAAKSPDA